MNESELPSRLSHKSRLISLDNDQVLSQPSSPQRNLKISELKLQVENYLDQLEQKVTTVKEKNLAEFLVAYKGYMDKIKRDLQLLKQKSDEMEKYYKENERIQSMEKQLEWFREESVKLYTKVEQKNKEIFELKFEIQGIKQENEFLENQVKSLMRKNKQFEVILKTQPDQPSKILDTVQTNIFCTQTKARRIMSSHKRESPQNQQELKHLPYIQEIIRKNSESDQNSIAKEIAIYFDTMEKSQIKQNKLMKSKLNSVIGQSTKLTTNKSELEEFFLDCVETLRRDIIKRKAIGTFQEQEFLRMNQDYQMFRKEDKFKILEMLLTHEKLIMLLYQKIFPSKFSQQIHTLNTVPNIDPIAQQQDYADLMQQLLYKRKIDYKKRKTDLQMIKINQWAPHEIHKVQFNTIQTKKLLVKIIEIRNQRKEHSRYYRLSHSLPPLFWSRDFDQNKFMNQKKRNKLQDANPMYYKRQEILQLLKQSHKTRASTPDAEGKWKKYRYLKIISQEKPIQKQRQLKRQETQPPSKLALKIQTPPNNRKTSNEEQEDNIQEIASSLLRKKSRLQLQRLTRRVFAEQLASNNSTSQQISQHSIATEEQQARKNIFQQDSYRLYGLKKYNVNRTDNLLKKYSQSPKQQFIKQKEYQKQLCNQNLKKKLQPRKLQFNKQDRSNSHSSVSKDISLIQAYFPKLDLESFIQL